MKKSFLVLITFSFLFVSCGKKEKEQKFEISKIETFAYNIGDAWEVNALARVKGFTQQKQNDKFSTEISYDVDLQTPKGNTIKSLISKVADKSDTEEMQDTQLDIQFNLDSTYAVGEYRIIINAKDVKSGQTDSSSASFKVQ